MEITIKGSPKEIAELVSKLQAQRPDIDFEEIIENVERSILQAGEAIRGKNE